MDNIRGVLFDYGGIFIKPHYDVTEPELIDSERMLTFLSELRNKGLQIGLMSNVNPETAMKARQRGDYDPFDFAQLSCEVGLRKPDPNAFKLAVSQFRGLEIAEILFIDDTERHVQGATEFGMNVIFAPHDTTLLIQSINVATH